MRGQKLPNDCGERKQAKASHGRTCGVHACSLPSPDTSVHTIFFFLLLLMFFNQGRTRRKNCREGQQESCYDWPIVLRHETGNGGDDATEKKTQCELAPSRVPKGRNIHSYGGLHLKTTAQSPKAMANQNGMAQSVTQSALKGYRIRIQLTNEAKMKNAIAPTIIERASSAA